MHVIRLHFSKTGDAKYISHLDLVRCFTRAIKRSGTDVWYTQGFNSRMYLLFALPLALGLESLSETVDIKSEAMLNGPFLIERINPCLPEGINVYNCTIPKYNHNEIASARYLLNISDSPEYLGMFETSYSCILSAMEILVEKTGKKGASKVDIRSQIIDSNLFKSDGNIVVHLHAAAGSTKNLNPVLLFEKIVTRLERRPSHYSLTRTGILTRGGEYFE